MSISTESTAPGRPSFRVNLLYIRTVVYVGVWIAADVSSSARPATTNETGDYFTYHTEVSRSWARCILLCFMRDVDNFKN